MNEEEKFDELINSKLSEREFPFDELNWDEAERLIIRQERWRKITRFSLVFSGGLVAGIAVMLPFILNTHTSSPSATSNITNINKIPDSQKSVSVTSVPPTQNATENKVSNPTNASLPVQSAFVKKDNSTGKRSKPGHISMVTAKSNKPMLAIANGGIKKAKPHHQGKTRSDIIVSAKTKQANPLYTNVSPTHKLVVPEKQITSVTPAPEIVNNNSKTINDNTATVLSPSSEKPIPLSTQTPVISNKQNNTPVTNTNTSGKNTTAGIEPSLISNKMSPKRDTSFHSNTSMIPGTTPNYPPYTANILSVYAGGNYSLGWTNNGITEGSGITPLGGFTYTHYFSIKFSASIGVGYSELNKLDKSYTSNTIQYDFGQNANITSVTPEKVYYMAFPARFHYSVGKSIFTGGIDFLWLLTTSSQLTTYKQNYLGQESGNTSQMQNGYTEGFNNMDFQFIVGYTRMLTERLGISAEYYYGLAYVENSSFPGINNYDRNKGFRLVLSYQLMK